MESARKAMATAMRVGSTYPSVICRYGLATALFDQKRVEDARYHFNMVQSAAKNSQSPWIEFMYLLAAAYFDIKSDQKDQGLEQLKQGFKLGRRHSFTQIYFWQPQMMIFLCVQALQANIETTYVQKVIQKYNLRPESPPYHIENWPWTIKIFTLGQFKIIVNNKPVNSRKKSKPLELLKVLVAMGGRDIKEEQLTDILWPDTEGDSAHISFNTTLHRLRKKLKCEKAVLLCSRRVSLNPHYCWLDTWALEYRLEALFNAKSSSEKK